MRTFWQGPSNGSIRRTKTAATTVSAETVAAAQDIALLLELTGLTVEAEHLYKTLTSHTRHPGVTPATALIPTLSSTDRGR